ncbi:zinc finger protein OZF-like [Topomyia yanbarensis]|uniref:zinc finger protein OZF-like n=1 Tax=Topomyia yanbarensis TaxID=2498891 RepID=UPI00273ADD44|nr:zinc finger protein OZF-like [Topomyia yanbarensis]
MSTIPDISGRCRCCMAEEVQMVHAFEILHEFGVKTSDLIVKFGGIVISENDHYPKNVCSRCVNELKIAVRFRQRCLDTEEILKNTKLDMENQFLSQRSYDISCSKNLVEIPLEQITEYDNDATTIKTENEHIEFPDDRREGTENPSSDSHQAPDEQILLDHSKSQSTSHAGELEHRCEMCGEEFSKEYDLTYHMRIHAADRPFRCEVCGNRYTRKSELTHHQRSHSSDRPRKCEICGKEFYKTGNLTQHMRSHTGERQFKCDICGRDFFRKAHLTEHRRLHTGERPHKCDICGQEFSRSTDYTHHMRVHAGERPFKCDVCGAEFFRNSSLVCHQKIHKKPKERRKLDRPGKLSTDAGLNGDIIVDAVYPGDVQ